MERPADNKALSLINKLDHPDRVVSAPYVLTPHGTKFLRDLTVTLPVAKMGDRNLQVAYLEDENDKSWEVIGVPQNDGKKASLEIGHFSVLVLILADEPVPEVDASDDIDAGVGGDAGGLVDASEAPDAGAAGEAGADIDASFDAAVDAGPTSLYQRLIDCKLVDMLGTFVDNHPPYGPYEQCKRDCLLASTCGDVQSYHCFGGDFSPSPALLTCQDNCAPQVPCPGTPDTAARCDGTPYCHNGEDEQDCLAGVSFACGGTNYPALVRCDGNPDCPNSEDELGCPLFTCPGTSNTIRAAQVCDGPMDCFNTQNPEQSDEPSTCVQVICPVGG